MVEIKPLAWIGGSKTDLSEFPEEVKDSIGYALYAAQQGEKHHDAKPLRGFGGSDVLEIVDNYAGNTYRAIYTVRFSGRIYVLHVFQKKSKSGIKTPKGELRLVQSRLKRAEGEHDAWLSRRKGITQHG